MSLNSTKKKKLCLKCMECCKVFYVPTRVWHKSHKEFYEMHSCSIKDYKGTQVLVVPLVCQHLTPEGCGIYDKRPEVCIDYDGTKDPLMKDKCLWMERNRRK